jgi:peptidoglycan/xylan/chitin deacetylase (PgdA/CDA1 family)
VALTYDDGPDPVSTPAFLALLAAYDVRATFFLLGEHAVRHPALVREIADAGHELAVHGWTHRATPTLPPGVLAAQVRRAAVAIEEVGGTPVHLYRPPYGVLSTETLVAGRTAGLRTVLWSAWGRDWERTATPERVVRTVTRTLRPGGTVLLHDTDRTAAPESWRVTLAASRALLEEWRADDLPVGPLSEHWLVPARPRVVPAAS